MDEIVKLTIAELRIHEHTERRDNGALDVDFMIPGSGCGGGKKVEKGP